MLSCNKSLIISALICFSLITIISEPKAIGSAGKPAIGAVVMQPDVNQISMLPYKALVIGDNVQIRSGPGANYYVCGKLNKNDMVQVISQKTNWYCITPPAGSFSWIAKQYVKLDAGNPENATVISDSVNVRAGNADSNPYHSSIVQGSMNKGDKVKITGEELNDYYKITPPSFAYVWASSEFVKLLGPDTTTEKTTVPVIDSNSSEAKYLQQYYALEKMVKTESGKPLMSQDFSKVKPALELLASNAQAGKAGRLAQYTLKQISDAETAMRVQKELAEQEKIMRQTRENIAKAAEIRKSELPNLGRYAAIGRFQVLAIYGQETRYKILDTEGSIICTAVPQGSAAVDLNKFMNKNVGLVGTIEANPETSGALVRFTEIVELPQ